VTLRYAAIPGQKFASNMLDQWNYETMPLSLPAAHAHPDISALLAPTRPVSVIDNGVMVI
jgi:hypothetical protein